MDWDDIRFFLAVARSRSLAGAAAELDVNQTTVSRRLASLEERLAVRLFDRLPTGYAPTAAGATILENAARMEEAAAALERRALGRDARLSGRLRVTVSETVAAYLLLPRLHEFTEAHPEIELEILSTDAALDLTRREADVAVRVADKAAENLVGRKIATLRYAVYATRAYLDAHPDLDSPSTGVLTWIQGDCQPPWSRDNFPRARVALRLGSVVSLVAGAKAGLGLALLPCFIGEQEEALVRVPTGHEVSGWSLWVLSHADLRSTARVKAFRDFVCAVLESQKELLAPRWR